MWANVTNHSGLAMYYVLVVVCLQRGWCISQDSHTQQLEKSANGGTEFHKAKKSQKVMRIVSFLLLLCPCIHPNLAG